jgi:hypothetical protein
MAETSDAREVSLNLLVPRLVNGVSVSTVQLFLARDANSDEVRAALQQAVASRLRLPLSQPLRLLHGRAPCALSAAILLDEAPSLVLDAGVPARTLPLWRTHGPELATLACLFLFLTTRLSMLLVLPLSLCAAAVQPAKDGLLGRAVTNAAAWFTAYSFAAADVAVIPPAFSALGFLVAASVALWRSRLLALSTSLMVGSRVMDRMTLLEKQWRNPPAKPSKTT